MAVFNSDQISAGTPIGGVGEGGGQVREAYFSITVGVGATTTDTIVLGYLPPHSMVRSIMVKSAALGGATTLNVGDAGVGTAIAADADRYLVASNITTAGGVVNTMATTGVFFKNNTSQKIQITAAFAAGTVATAGLLEVSLTYSTEEPQQ